MKRVGYVVRGVVQGVGYRASARYVAEREGLTGWVRNLRDGNVEGEAQGSPEAIARFVAWCQRGPQGSRVDDVAIEELAVRDDETRFEIR